MLSRNPARLNWARRFNPNPNPETAFYAGPLPYKVAPVAGNPYAFLVHDGVSSGRGKGFSPANVNWLYRFRHNLNPMCRAVGMWNQYNPWAKVVHWLENRTSQKLANQAFSEECFPHCMLWIGVSLITVVHLANYILYHPEVSMINLVLWPSKPLVDFARWDTPYDLNTRAFRYVQGQLEYYMYSYYRELVRAGAVANDPWVEFCKENKTYDKLLLYPEEFHGRLWPAAPKKDDGHGHH